MQSFLQQDIWNVPKTDATSYIIPQIPFVPCCALSYWQYPSLKYEKYAFFDAVSPCSELCIGRRPWDLHSVPGLQTHILAVKRVTDSIHILLALTILSGTSSEAGEVGAELPHCVDDVTVVW